MAVPSIKFYNGCECPILGLGTWKSMAGEVREAVKAAIDIGYRHFDCAYVYENEEQVGEAIEEKIKQGVVKRQDLFITSKLWCTSHKKELVIPALKRTLKNLRTDYLDLYLMHWPMGFKEGESLFPLDANKKMIPSDSHFTETWAGLEECVDRKLARSIGISNFTESQTSEILKVARIKPANNQIENHPYLSQEGLVEFCLRNNITVTAYSPLGSPDRPEVYPDDPVLLEDPVVNSLAQKYNKSPAQIVIKFQIQRGIIVIPKSVTKSRIQTNFEVFDFTLSAEDMAALLKLNRNARMVRFAMTDNHRDYPFKS